MTKVTIILISNQTNDFVNKIEFDTNVNIDLTNIKLCGLFLTNPKIEGLEFLMAECYEKLESSNIEDLQSINMSILYGLQIIFPCTSIMADSLKEIDELLERLLNICKTHVDPECFMTEQIYGWRKMEFEQQINKIKYELLADLSIIDLNMILIQSYYHTGKINNEDYEEKIKNASKNKRDIITKTFDKILHSI